MPYSVSFVYHLDYVAQVALYNDMENIMEGIEDVKVIADDIFLWGSSNVTSAFKKFSKFLKQVLN